jgi:hypothetical protein
VRLRCYLLSEFFAMLFESHDWRLDACDRVRIVGLMAHQDRFTIYTIRGKQHTSAIGTEVLLQWNISIET